MADNRLAIDWGKVRIGVAAARGGTTFAFPVETVPADGKALDRLAELVDEYGADVVYVGLPLTLRGDRSHAAEFVLERTRQLARRIGTEKVRLVDERMSTASASRSLGAAGRSQKGSRGVIDQAAAVEILQQALDRERATGTVAGQSLDLEEL